MKKQLKFDIEARERLLKGVNIMAEAVGSTLGPKGRNVIIEREWGPPLILHDGVRVAESIDLEDHYENMGAQLLKEAAQKTNSNAGDGTTTSTILAQAIITEGFKNIQAGANPMVLKSGIEKAVLLVVEELDKMSYRLKSDAEVEQIATISAADPKVGAMIAEAIKRVGEDGVITTEDGKGLETTIDHKEGLMFDRGSFSPYFMTNQKQEAIVEDPYILITDKPISSMDELVNFLEVLVTVSKNLVIISPDVQGTALAGLVINKIQQVFNVVAVGAPSNGDNRKKILEDIAIVTGGVLISQDTGRGFDSVEVSELGRAKRVIATKDETLIVDGKGDPILIDSRIAQIKEEVKKSKNDFDREKAEERLAKLTSGVAIIQVGEATETELKEKKERVIDAVNAARAAKEDGIVPGGETALLIASLVVGSKETKMRVAEDDYTGVNIVREALKEPFKRLMENAGYNWGEQMGRVIEAPSGMGIDAMTGELCDLKSRGIIDPVKVTKAALINASSIAVMLLTANTAVALKPETDKDSVINPAWTN